MKGNHKMSWNKVELVENHRKIDVYVNFETGLIIKPVSSTEVLLEPLTKSVKIAKPIDYFEFLTEETPIFTQTTPIEIDTSGPKVISKAELEKKMGKTGPIVEKKDEKPKIVKVKTEPKVEKPVSRPGTTSEALDSTPEIMS